MGSTELSDQRPEDEVSYNPLFFKVSAQALRALVWYLVDLALPLEDDVVHVLNRPNMSHFRTSLAAVILSGC